MSFRDAACYVFAVTGYKDDQQMVLAGNAVNSASGDNSLNAMASNNLRIAFIVAEARQNSETGGELRDRAGNAVNIVIYGKFNNNNIDVSPMHYWIECNNYIIETWTDNDLIYETADASSRVQPQSLRGQDQGSYVVGCCKSLLTAYQARNIFDNNQNLYGILNLPSIRRR